MRTGQGLFAPLVAKPEGYPVADSPLCKMLRGRGGITRYWRLSQTLPLAVLFISNSLQTALRQPMATLTIGGGIILLEKALIAITR